MMLKKIMAFVLLGGLALSAAGQTEWTDLPLSDNTYFNTPTPYKQADYDIAVPAGVGLEFKVAMNEGDVMTYAWTVAMADPSLLDVEFHGHTEPVNGKGTVMFYKIHNDGKEGGALKAPFTGIHGWYLNNRGDEDVVVNLTASGFFRDTE